MNRLTIFCVAAALCGQACSTQDPKSAEQYFRDANDYYRNGGYDLAIEQYRELLDRHPFSDHTEEAELRIAHAHFLAADYTAAIVALTDFQRRHPTSDQLPLVGYLLGMSYVRQMGSADRDQTAAQSAHTYFATLLHQYPHSPFADLGREELAACRESLAEHELGIARFYENRGNDDAAEVRLLSLSSKFGETQTAALALLRLTRQYVREGNSDHAVLAARAVEALHPDSAEARQARSLVAAADAAAVPPTTDPLDLLMIANGRVREDTAFGVPKAPTASERSGRPRFGGANMPRADPLGGGAPF